MKIILILSLAFIVNGCESAGKVLNDSLHNIQYSTNEFTAKNYVGLKEEELLKKIGKAEKEIILSSNKKLLYGRRSDAYLLIDKKIDRAYQVSEVSYEVKYASMGGLASKGKTIGFVNAGEPIEAISFESTIEPLKNLLKFKGYKVLDNAKTATIVIYVNYGSKKSLSEIKNLDPAFYRVENKSESSYLRYLDLEAKEKGATVWKYKSLSEGSKSAVEPAVAALAFAGYNDIPKNTTGTKVESIPENDPVFDIIGRNLNSI